MVTTDAWIIDEIYHLACNKCKLGKIVQHKMPVLLSAPEMKVCVCVCVCGLLQSSLIFNALRCQWWKMNWGRGCPNFCPHWRLPQGMGGEKEIFNLEGGGGGGTNEWNAIYEWLLICTIKTYLLHSTAQHRQTHTNPHLRYNYKSSQYVNIVCHNCLLLIMNYLHNSINNTNMVWRWRLVCTSVQWAQAVMICIFKAFEQKANKQGMEQNFSSQKQY